MPRQNENAGGSDSPAPPTLPPADPLLVGLAALKAEDPDALRIWSVKGPKQGGGTISGVLMQTTNEVVILHQFPSGRFAVFEKRKPVAATTDTE